MGRRPAGAEVKAQKTTRQIAAHFPEAVAWQLRQLAAERHMTIQALMAEALDDLFRKHGKPDIAEIAKARPT
jgi:hypothetical protein